MARRPSALAFACALLAGAGCADRALPRDETAPVVAPIWSRDFPSAGNVEVQPMLWPNGDLGLQGYLCDSGVVFDGFPVAAPAAACNAFVARLDGSGNVQRAWIDDPLTDGLSVPEPAGSLYQAVGVAEPNVDVWNDFFIRKIGADGVVAWSKAFALAPGGRLLSLTATAGGDLTASGTFTGTFDSGGAAIAARASSDNFRLRLDSNGAFISAATIGEPSLPLGIVAASPSGLIASLTKRAGVDDVWDLQVLDPDGLIMWHRSLDTIAVFKTPLVVFAGDELVIGVAITDATDLGDGPFPASPSARFAVAGFDRTGRLLWKRTFEGALGLNLTGLAGSAEGDIALCGFALRGNAKVFMFDSLAIPWSSPDSSEVSFNFVGKLSSDGHARWAQKIPGLTSNLYGSPSCAVNAAGAVLVADATARPSALYVAKYAP